MLGEAELLIRLLSQPSEGLAALAALAGVGRNTVNRIGNNHSEPHMTTVRKLAEALGVDPASSERTDPPIRV